MTPAVIEARIVDMLRARAATSSICPSDVARSWDHPERAWRALMAPVRQAAASLADREVVEVTQAGRTVDPEGPLRGPVRIRRGPAFPG